MSTRTTDPFIYDLEPEDAAIFIVEWYWDGDEPEIYEVKRAVDDLTHLGALEALDYKIVMESTGKKTFELTDGQWDYIQDHVMEEAREDSFRIYIDDSHY
jgi:hypothetical protein